MKSFTDYEQRKTSLLHAYDAVLGAGILPIEEIGQAQVEDRRRDLENGRFLVAVCGRIKAGKSTLLNALLFRDWVVPTDDLPLTAKNTLIEYGTVPALEVTFYDRTEWDALTRELTSSDRKVADEFFGEVEESSRHGVTEASCILEQAMVRHSDRIADLATFVTPAARGGIYTPFVKQVRLTFPHPWLKSVTIADTPGVDDPYKFREDQTKKFVTRAGAVLYVTYAGQAMAQQDFNFLNQYLIHVAPERRLIAVNKSDTLQQGTADVEDYLRSLRDSPEPAIRSVFGKADSVRMVSALGALIGEALKEGRTLSDDNAYYRKLLEKSGYLDAGKHGIDSLRSLVEERLVSQDGASIVRDHAKFLTALFERKRRLAQRDISLLETHLFALGQTEEQLRTEIDEIHQQLALMERTLKKGENQVKKTFGSVVHRLSETFGLVCIKIVGQVDQKLKQETDIDSLGTNAAWHFATGFTNERASLEKALIACVDGIETSLKDFGDSLRTTWADGPSAGYMDDTLSYSLYDTLHILKNLQNDIGSAEQLEKVREESTLFFQRWFNTNAGRSKAVAAIVNKLQVRLNEAMQTESDRVKETLHDEVKTQLARVAGQLKKAQATRLDDLKKLTQGRANRTADRAQTSVNIAAIEAELAQSEKLKASIQGVLL